MTGYQVYRDGTSLRMVDSTTYDAYWLSPGRTYLFEVRTKDNEGYFSEPARLQVTTPEASTPPGPVRNLRLSTTGSPTLAWAPPETGAAIQYIVSKDDRQWAATVLPLCLIELPAAGEAYLYEVRARNMTDQFSEPVAIRTGFAPPHVLNVRDVTKTSFRLAWDTPPGAVGITGYQLTLDDAVPFCVSETQHIFSGLTRAGNYTVTVKTQIESGELSEPTSIDLYIQGDAPSAPQNFRYTQPADETILEWDAPREPVTGYQVTLVNPQGKEFNYRPSATTMRERLTSRTRYEVRIVASNNAGPSRPLITDLTTK
ncbi:fibronectin type III domain-containing protein [Pseudomonas sp. NFX224]|uniref:fibronectin type III domain-containing protein n=1 Tax=Pseudomonas sp. NFX224 TaxID=3402862 RepID=UPI003AFA42E6